MRVIAHRGASADFPEQTAAALREAWRQGADGVEVDLRRMADDRLLLQHDADLWRCCGDRRRVARLDQNSRRSLNACARRPELPAEAPLLLDELLALRPPDRWLLLELKEGPEQVGPLLEALAGRSERVRVLAFRRETLLEARCQAPALPLLWLRAASRPPAPRTLAGWLRGAQAAGFHGLDLEQAGLTDELCRAVRGAGLELGAWTVDEPARARQLRDWGLDWLTSNRPGLIRQALAQD
ncbi:MAG: glycerophosphodiester phosphodiesterase family protein [Candidatus Delongbacteria bacterium]